MWGILADVLSRFLPEQRNIIHLSFALAYPNRLESLFAKAGFRDVQSHNVAAPLRMASAAECVQWERESFAGLQQMLVGLNKVDQQEVWREIESELAKYGSARGFESPCEVIVGVGIK